MKTPAMTCAICGAVIMGRHFVNVHGERYCAAHRHPDKCAWCGRLGGLRLGQNVARCAECDPLCVDRVDQFEKLRQNVLGVLTSWLGAHRLAEVPASMSGGMIISGRSRRVGRTHSTADSTAVDLCVKVSPGMPVELAGAVLMHEYGHVVVRVDPRSLQPWKARRRLEHDEEEGACEVLAAEWLMLRREARSAHELRRLTESPDPVYGEGYRKMAQRRAAFGSITDWLEAELFGVRTSRVKGPLAR